MTTELPPAPPALRRRRRLVLAALVASQGLPGLARAEPGVSAKDILIGQSISLQDGKNSYGVEVQAGVASVLEPLNASGGINGRRVLLRTLDDRNNARQAEDNAHQLLKASVFMLFGSIEGGPSSAIAGVAEAQKVPFFGPMAGSPGLRRPHLSMVFPVRAEHREEFRALIGWARRTGLSRMALMHADSDVGRQHLDNTRLLGLELGAELVYGVPFKGDIDDAGLRKIIDRMRREPVQFMFNHGATAVFGRLIKLAREAGLGTVFMGVNSGSTELARALGDAARGMVFSQVMPSPWARRTALARDYQAAFQAQHPGRALSYASLEGFATAKALVASLRLAGPHLTRSTWLQALEAADIDLGGLPLRYRLGDHAGAHFVDLAIVTREGRFLQ